MIFPLSSFRNHYITKFVKIFLFLSRTVINHEQNQFVNCLSGPAKIEKTRHFGEFFIFHIDELSLNHVMLYTNSNCTKYHMRLFRVL